jgi:hypothetical protein
VLACAGALGAALWAAPVEAGPVTVRWRHAEPGRVAGFRLHVGSEPGRYTRTIDLGLPPADFEGVYRAEVELPDDAPSYLAISAYGEGGEESARSNEMLRAPAPPAAGLGTPGRPRVVGR